MGDYTPPAEPVTVDRVVVERCDVDVSADVDEVAYDRGIDLDVCLDVDLGHVVERDDGTHLVEAS